jgi:hypothetical protein
LKKTPVSNRLCRANCALKRKSPGYKPDENKIVSKTITLVAAERPRRSRK